MNTRVGAIAELWRYPVKSMLGESLDQAEIGFLGLSGDRAFAVLDHGSGRIVSAKRLASLFVCSARSVNGTVLVTLRDDSEIPIEDPELGERLSAELGRSVGIAHRDSIPEPRIEIASGSSTDEGPSQEFDGLPGTFFDAAPVHLLTTASLRAASALDPSSTYEARRFRPNVLLDVEGNEFVEQRWVDRRIVLGEVELQVIKACGRCVMTTHAQSELAKERGVLKSLARHNDTKLGVLCSVASGGAVVPGDEAWIG